MSCPCGTPQLSRAAPAAQRPCPPPQQPIRKEFTVPLQPSQPAQPQQVVQKIVVREGAQQQPAPVYQTIYVDQPDQLLAAPVITTEVVREPNPCSQQQPSNPCGCY
jgi:hypothetical protein